MTTIKIKEASEYLGMSEYMVRKLCKAKQLPHIKAGGTYLFRTHSLNEWMSKQEEINTTLNQKLNGIQQIAE